MPNANAAFNRLSIAANTILAHVTAKVGRALYEAPDEDLVPLMVAYGVKLPAKLWRELYDAADPTLVESHIDRECQVLGHEFALGPDAEEGDAMACIHCGAEQ